jgi:hypothetical protein
MQMPPNRKDENAPFLPNRAKQGEIPIYYVFLTVKAKTILFFF